jgi:16S rRNA (adenine1518-N6/adenine1519-N6)-dimethyltransferase
MTDLPPLREVIERHGLSARKSLGQNFLLDLNLTRRIAREGGVAQGDTVLEIGPGPGGLTRALLEAGAHVIAVEKDSRAIAALAELGAAFPNRLTIHEGDALKIDEGGMVGDARPLRIVANLPYNIATALLIKWLAAEPWPPFYASMTLMFQREVADRIVAGRGDKAYGRLAVLTSLRCQARRLFDIPPRAFLPSPKVVSSVVHLVPVATGATVPLAALSKVTEAAFGQRRKMLRQSLKSVFQNAVNTLDSMEIDPTLRAENLSPMDFLRLARSLDQPGG